MITKIALESVVERDSEKIARCEGDITEPISWGSCLVAVGKTDAIYALRQLCEKYNQAHKISTTKAMKETPAAYLSYVLSS